MKKILIVETNINQYLPTNQATGIWLEEVTGFYDVVTNAGFTVDFASINGGSVPIDPNSLNADTRTMTIYNNPKFYNQAIKNTKKISDVNSEDYIAIYFAGGHGVMWDFPDNSELQKLTEMIYQNGVIYQVYVMEK